MLNIHEDIKERIDMFINKNCIPNLIFHGPSGSGKRTIANEFVSKIYDADKELVRSYVMWENCAHGKGIRFVREDLKLFAKTNINFNNKHGFKTIVLENADYLTIDAQSALRRCIELFSHTTRFFLIVEDKHKLLRPILSRFCEVFVPLPKIAGKLISLHLYHIINCFEDNKQEIRNAVKWFDKKIRALTTPNYQEVMLIATQAYERGYSGLDILEYIKTCNLLSPAERAKQLIGCHSIKSEFRNEKLCMLCMLSSILIRSNGLFKNMLVV